MNLALYFYYCKNITYCLEMFLSTFYQKVWLLIVAKNWKKFTDINKNHKRISHGQKKLVLSLK